MQIQLPSGLELAELRKQLAVGLEQADRGASVPLNMNAILAEAMRLLQQEQETEKDKCPTSK